MGSAMESATGRAMGKATGWKTWRGIAAAVAMAAPILGAAGMVSPAAADEATRLDPIVVTATRIEQRASEASSSISVVTGEEIREKGSVNVGDVIRDLPAVSVQRSGRQGTLEQVRIRGVDSNQVLVMVDGIPMNSPSSGDIDLSDLVVSGIDRIEVVRGAQSALYGSNAIGGVVNIITKKPLERGEFRERIEAGSHKTINNYLGVDAGTRDFSLSVDTALLSSAGERNNDDYRNGTVNLRAVARPTDRTTFSFLGIQTNSRKDIPVSVEFDLATFNLVQYFDPNSGQNRIFTLVGGTLLHEISRKASVEFKASVQREILENTDGPEPGDPFVLNTKTASRKKMAEARTVLRPATWNTLILGGQYTGDAANFSGDETDRAMNNRALYVQDEIRVGRFFASAGMRYDDHSFAGSRTSVRISTAVTGLPAGLKWKGSYGTGFRSPTLVDLFFPFFGNRNVRPETAKSFETGLEGRYLGGRLRAEGNFFYLRFRDLIEADPATFRAENIGKAFTRGVELSAEGPILPELVLSGRYTHLDTMNQVANRELLRRPHNQYQVSGRFFPGQSLTARADYTIVSSMSGLRIAGLPERNPGWERMDVSVLYSLPEKEGRRGRWTLTGRIANLFDRKYSEVEGFPAPGINFLIGAEVNI